MRLTRRPLFAFRHLAVFVASCALACLATPSRAQLADSVHLRDASAHASGPTLADQLAPSFGPRAAKPCWTVFGYLPYWSSTSNIRWDLLTHLACFSVGLNASGTVSNTIGWPWNATINTAKANGVRIHLVVTSFDPTTTRNFLNSTTARNAFINNIRPLVANIDGINLDFEGAGTNGWPSLVPGFIQQLRAAMRAQVKPDFEVSIATPAVNWNSSWPLASVAAQADQLFLMGYDYYGSFSTTTGPSAPLTGGSFNITNSLNNDYAAVVTQHPKKLILGMPWYGNQWITSTNAPYSTVISHVGSVTFATAQTNVATYGRLFDLASQTPLYRWQSSGQWNQVWYDDTMSLGRKIDAATTRGLAGVGMWALGYQGSRPELWDLLEQKLVDTCPRCPADFNDDGFVDFTDFDAFVTAFEAGATGADFNADGFIDFTDFDAFVAAFEAGC